MARYGTQFGPDVTFLGVERCDLDDPASYAGADVVVLGAPFDGGTSHRPGTRFGPQAIRTTDYLGHDGSRPSLALRTDGLRDLRVLDAGDVEMPPGDVERALAALEAAVERIARAGAVPVVLGGDHSIAYADARGVAHVVGHGRVSMVHFDAHADTGDIAFGSLWGHGQPMRRLIESGALRGDRFLQVGLRGYWPPPDVLDWMAAQRMRSYEMSEIGARGLDACLAEAVAAAQQRSLSCRATCGGGRVPDSSPPCSLDAPDRHHPNALVALRVPTKWREDAAPIIRLSALTANNRSQACAALHACMLLPGDQTTPRAEPEVLRTPFSGLGASRVRVASVTACEQN